MDTQGGPSASRLRKLLAGGGTRRLAGPLLIGAGLLARTFLNLAHTNSVFRTDHLLTFFESIRSTRLSTTITPTFYNPRSSVSGKCLKRSPAALVTDIPLSSEDFYASGRFAW